MDDRDSLRVCAGCGCRLLYCASVNRAAHGSWVVVLECPNCWEAWARIVNGGALNVLEEGFSEDVRAIARDLGCLEHENQRADAEQFEDEIGRFSAALEADAILPMDF